MCHRDSDRATFSTITLTELTWNESSCKHKTPTLIIICIGLTPEWPSAQLHTCDKKRSVVGLTEILPDFFPWLFFTEGVSGAWRSNRTLVSPIHSAKYLLNDQKTCSNLNLKWYEARFCSFITPWQRNVTTYGKSWFSSLLEIHILSISCHEDRDAVMV